ncbi:molybdenum cofactor guanylyltransferase [Cytophagaceae bacterium ABcell3]|nr:molybdenum cofactor guanylyltransferase [Cytophagaceae bacterium ABcell3]
MKATGIILAGGKSSRMKEYPKGLLTFNGDTFVNHIANELEKVTSEIIVNANSHKYDHLGYQVVTDVMEEKGPLGGIYSALQQSSNPLNIVVACDMPMVSASFMQMLLENIQHFDAAIPKTGELLQPLYACYNKSSLSKLQDLINEDFLKLQQLPAKLNCNVITCSLKGADQYLNINTPEDYKKLTSEL